MDSSIVKQNLQKKTQEKVLSFRNFIRRYFLKSLTNITNLIICEKKQIKLDEYVLKLILESSSRLIGKNLSFEFEIHQTLSNSNIINDENYKDITKYNDDEASGWDTIGNYIDIAITNEHPELSIILIYMFATECFWMRESLKNENDSQKFILLNEYYDKLNEIFEYYKFEGLDKHVQYIFTLVNEAVIPKVICELHSDTKLTGIIFSYIPLSVDLIKDLSNNDQNAKSNYVSHLKRNMKKSILEHYSSMDTMS